MPQTDEDSAVSALFHRVGRGRDSARRAPAFAALLAGVVAAHLWLLGSMPAARPAASAARMIMVRAIAAEPALRATGSKAADQEEAGARSTAAAPPVRRPRSAAPPSVRPAPREWPRHAAPAVGTHAALGAGPADAPSSAAGATAPAQSDALPLYATRPAPPVVLVYRLQRGEQLGSASLVWQPDAAAGRYEATLSGAADAGRGVLLHWSSRGAIDAAAGLAPERFVLREPRRGALAANFDREARRITYSGPPVVHALPDGAQDRLSWLVQLAAIVAADPARHGAAGAEIDLFVAGARGDADAWRFDALGAQTLELPDGAAIQTLAYARAARRAYDVRIEVWLAPSLAFLPVRLRVLPTGAGRPLELLLAALP
jgi:hypothetical protein